MIVGMFRPSCLPGSSFQLITTMRFGLFFFFLVTRPSEPVAETKESRKDECATCSLAPGIKTRGHLKSQGRIFPFKYGAFTIGNPARRELNGNGISSISDPDPSSPPFRYTLSCGPNSDADLIIFKNWRNGPNDKLTTGSDRNLTFKVIYFISSRRVQYIFGTLGNLKGNSTGVPMWVESAQWDCDLFVEKSSNTTIKEKP